MRELEHIAADPDEFKPKRGMGEWWDGGSNRKARRKRAAQRRAAEKRKAAEVSP